LPLAIPGDARADRGVELETDVVVVPLDTIGFDLALTRS
jgi:hypothetical protein